ncbi:uncharacterized protein LOC128715277 [Anopheles marshallii]|uniref:uncharacterized protein LOC128715277 n=1 Tax=Anopheles marshallii TaxID=1521116 RepID=UPI00237A5352|nr:uncharacterized protein LOC128715277 [Anopheles marshallii]
MKAVYVLAIALCLAVATQAAPQLPLTLLSTLSQTITKLVTQITTLLNNVLTAAGTTTQSALSSVVANALSLLYGLANATLSLFTVPQAALTAVNSLLTNAVGQIIPIVRDAGTTLATLVPALGNVQTILSTLVGNLGALNQSGLAPLQATLTQLANTLGSAVTQISG